MRTPVLAECAVTWRAGGVCGAPGSGVRRGLERADPRLQRPPPRPRAGAPARRALARGRRGDRRGRLRQPAPWPRGDDRRPARDRGTDRARARKQRNRGRPASGVRGVGGGDRSPRRGRRARRSPLLRPGGGRPDNTVGLELRPLRRRGRLDARRLPRPVRARRPLAAARPPRWRGALTRQRGDPAGARGARAAARGLRARARVPRRVDDRRLDPAVQPRAAREGARGVGDPAGAHRSSARCADTLARDGRAGHASRRAGDADPGEVALARLRPRARRGTCWLARASLDARDALIGRRDPLVPLAASGCRASSPARAAGSCPSGCSTPERCGPATGCSIAGAGPGASPPSSRATCRAVVRGLIDVVTRVDRMVPSAHHPRGTPPSAFTLVDVDNPRYNPGGGRAAAGFGFPYPDDDFDLAFAVSVFTHLRPTESEAYLREAARVLRPGGRLVSTFFLLNAESDTLSRLRREHDSPLYGAGPRSFEHELRDGSGHRFRTSSPELPEHRIGLEEDDALALHDAAGLDVVEVRHGHWPGRPRQPGRLGHDLVVAVARWGGPAAQRRASARRSSAIRTT